MTLYHAEHTTSTTITQLDIRIYLLFLKPPVTTEIYTLSLHDALPICLWSGRSGRRPRQRRSRQRRLRGRRWPHRPRSEEHTSELQSRFDLVCRLLLEKKTRRRRGPRRRAGRHRPEDEAARSRRRSRPP